MLLSSDRHTAADLAAWREYERADAAAVVSAELIDSSIACLRDFAKQSQSYVACSWGKDSVVLLHLALTAGLELPIVYVRFSDQHNPECDRVRDVFLRQWPCDYHEVSMTRAEAGKGKHWKAAAKIGGRPITGIRADESSSRHLSAWTHGMATKNTCRPLLWWQSQQIFGYIHQHDLPLNAVYAMLGGGRYEREHLRTHSIGGETARNHGRGEWEQEYFPDVLNRLRHAQAR